MKQTEGEPGRWFYVREGRRHGPVDVARLVDLILVNDVPEDTLVWRSGLADWRPAREVDEIQRELPPPVPVAPPAPSRPRAEADEGEEEDEDEYEDDPEGEPETTETNETPESANGDADSPPVATEAGSDAGDDGQRRRKKKRKHRRRDSRPQWLVPLLLVLLFLMMGLWWLLRRMNEVPAGRIIQTGSLSAPRLDASPASPRASPPPRRV